MLHKHNCEALWLRKVFFSSTLKVSVCSAEIYLQAEECMRRFLTAYGTETPQQPVKPQCKVFFKLDDSLEVELLLLTCLKAFCLNPVEDAQDTVHIVPGQCGSRRTPRAQT